MKSDWLLGLGALSVTAGALWWFPPIGLIVFGMFCLGFGFFSGVRDAGHS